MRKDSILEFSLTNEYLNHLWKVIEFLCEVYNHEYNILSVIHHPTRCAIMIYYINIYIIYMSANLIIMMCTLWDITISLRWLMSSVLISYIITWSIHLHLSVTYCPIMEVSSIPWKGWYCANGNTLIHYYRLQSHYKDIRMCLGWPLFSICSSIRLCLQRGKHEIV